LAVSHLVEEEREGLANLALDDRPGDRLLEREALARRSIPSDELVLPLGVLRLADVDHFLPSLVPAHVLLVLRILRTGDVREVAVDQLQRGRSIREPRAHLRKLWDELAFPLLGVVLDDVLEELDEPQVRAFRDRPDQRGEVKPSVEIRDVDPAAICDASLSPTVAPGDDDERGGIHREEARRAIEDEKRERRRDARRLAMPRSLRPAAGILLLLEEPFRYLLVPVVVVETDDVPDVGDLLEAVDAVVGAMRLPVAHEEGVAIEDRLVHGGFLVGVEPHVEIVASKEKRREARARHVPVAVPLARIVPAAREDLDAFRADDRNLGIGRADDRASLRVLLGRAARTTFPTSSRPLDRDPVPLALAIDVDDEPSLDLGPIRLLALEEVVED